MTPSMRISADEINCLIYAYLQDSGFQHSSFALRTEGHLDLSPHAKTPIRRGELVELLTKALLYTEVEAHWKLDANATKCSAPFSLLVPHVCSTRPALRQHTPVPVSASPRPELFAQQANGATHDIGNAQKRKASPITLVDNRAEKKPRTTTDDDALEKHIDVNAIEKSSKQLSSSATIRHPEKDEAGIHFINGSFRLDAGEHPVSATPSRIRTVDEHDVNSTEQASAQFSKVARDIPNKNEEIDLPLTFVNGTIRDAGKCLQPGTSPRSRKVDEHDVIAKEQVSMELSSKADLHPPDQNHEGEISPYPDGLIWNVNQGLQSGISSEAHRVGETDSPVTLLQGHDAEVFSAAWNPAHPDLLATGSKDATVRIWSWEDVKSHILDQGPPDSPFSASPPASQFSRPEPSVLLHQPRSDQPDITSLDWNVDGTLLATGSYDRLLRIWRVTGEPYMTQIYHSGPIFSVQFSKTGKWLLSASLDGTACVWDVATKKLTMQFKVHTSCLDVDWLDEATFVTCSAEETVHLVSLASSEAIRTFIGHTNEVNQVKFNKQKTLLASCSDDHTARIWSSEAWTNPDGSIVSKIEPGFTKEQIAKRYPAKFVLEGHENSVGAVRWCPVENDAAETLLATCSFDKTARLWDASNGTCLRVFTENTKALFSITFSPEGKFVATGSEDGYLYIYNAATGNKVWRWPATGTGAGPIYDVNWQKLGGHLLAMCMKSKIVGVVDTDKIPELTLPVSSS